MADKDAKDMFVTGAAGTGKTTALRAAVEYCIDKEIAYCVCAYTHKAVSVLQSKLPLNAGTSTLHAFLTKRPTINANALKLTHLDGNIRASAPEPVSVLFIDEFSMVGSRDYLDIKALQLDPADCVIQKVVYIGDLNQLPPVKDKQVIEPKGDYHLHLTEVFRQAGDNPLLDTLTALSSYLEGKPVKELKPHKTFIRGIDIVKRYKELDECKLLAYTNARVQELNAKIEGKDIPEKGDTIFNSTNRNVGRFEHFVPADKVQIILDKIGEPHDDTTQYRKLKTLKEMKIQFAELQEEYNEDGDTLTHTRAIVFGHKNYLDRISKLKAAAVGSNKVIAITCKTNNPAEWAKDNSYHKLAKLRAKAWRHYMAFEHCVFCVDFNHAMTVHKSQGSTFKVVLLDVKDLEKCRQRNFKLYLKLMYVGISRASDKVYTS